MPTVKAKGIHTSPEKAGRQNLEPIKDTLPKDEDNIMAKILPVYKRSEGYTSLWTDEQFEKSISEFFDYCNEVQLKPTQPLLRVWLKVSRSQIFDWRTKPEKYRGKSDILENAFSMMEIYLQANIDKYPTGSIFLLKSSHGHAETTNININSGNNVNPDEVAETVAKLGLDK